MRSRAGNLSSGVNRTKPENTCFHKAFKIRVLIPRYNDGSLRVILMRVSSKFPGKLPSTCFHHFTDIKTFFPQGFIRYTNIPIKKIVER